MSEIHFIEKFRIPSITQQEHRIGISKNGKGYIYEQQELKDARALIRAHMAQHKPDAPLSGPLFVSVSWMYNDAEGKHDDLEYKVTKPDTGNLNKMLLDEMTRLGYWKDDAVISVELTRKFWTHDFEGVIITAMELPKVGAL